MWGRVGRIDALYLNACHSQNVHFENILDAVALGRQIMDVNFFGAVALVGIAPSGGCGPISHIERDMHFRARVLSRRSMLCHISKRRTARSYACPRVCQEGPFPELAPMGMR